MLLYSLEVPKGVWRVWYDHHLYWPDVWADYEKIAQQINAVTSPDDPVYATDDSVYVAARQPPPRGAENLYGAALRLVPEDYVRAGLVPPDRIETELRSGQFAAVVLFKPGNQAQIELLRRSELYSQYAETNWYVIFGKPRMVPVKESCNK
jgi:hypothetical protein